MKLPVIYDEQEVRTAWPVVWIGISVQVDVGVFGTDNDELLKALDVADMYERAANLLLSHAKHRRSDPELWEEVDKA